MVPAARVLERCSSWAGEWRPTRLVTDGEEPVPLVWVVPAGVAAHAAAVSLATHLVQLLLAAVVVGVALQRHRMHQRPKQS